MPRPWGGWDGHGDERERESEAVLVELQVGDAWARWPWQYGGGEGAGKKRLHCYGNEMGGIENENGMDLHDWSSYLFEHDSALEDDSEVQIIKSIITII